MKEKINSKSVIGGLLVVIMGICLVLMDIFCIKTSTNVWISIGCSLVASGMVILLTAILIERNQVSPLEEWGIIKIYSTRAEKNADSDPELDRAKYKVDAIAFGLSNFRSKYSRKVEKCLEKGVNFRILTMNPESEFISQREIEENGVPGQIVKSINDLVEWADKLNNEKYKGKIIVKGYNCMTLDFYWRVDNQLFVGPYWYNQPSNQTITYAFSEGGKGFVQYSNYFEELWNNGNISKTLTQITYFEPK